MPHRHTLSPDTSDQRDLAHTTLRNVRDWGADIGQTCRFRLMTQSGHAMTPLDRRIDEPGLGGPAATMAIAKAYVDSHDRHTWQGAGCRTYVADEPNT